MKDKFAILEPESTYHIYNRANGCEKLFLSEQNYLYFLKKYSEYINPVADTFCYCLMPNHFHFLIRIKPRKDLEVFFQKDLQDFKNLEGLVANRFSNFFNSYAKAFNKMYHRRGSLFMHTFKRKQVTDIIYLRKLVHYIHYNPVESKLSKSITDWKFSSFKTLINCEETFLKREQVIEWFENNDNFQCYHSNKEIDPNLSSRLL